MKLLGFLFGFLVYSSCYATVWYDDDPYNHPQVDSVERILYKDIEEFYREINEYPILYFDVAPRTVGTLERSVNLRFRIEEMLNALEQQYPRSTNALEQQYPRSTNALERRVYSLKRENIRYYMRDIFVRGNANGRYAIDFQLPEEFLRPFQSIGIDPPCIAVILRTRNVFWLEERDTYHWGWGLDLPYQHFISSLKRIFEEILRSPPFLDFNTSEPLDGFGYTQPRNRFYAYARHTSGREVIRISDRQGNGRGFTTLIVMPPSPVRDARGNLQNPALDYGDLNVIILRTRFWFSSDFNERLIQSTIKPWLKLETTTDGSFPAAILRAIQDLQAKGIQADGIETIKATSSNFDYASEVQKLQVLCNRHAEKIAVRAADLNCKRSLRRAFLDGQQQITTFLSVPEWLRLDVAIRDRDSPALLRSLDAIAANNLNDRFREAAEMAERHLEAINAACHASITLTPGGEFALDERNLSHLAQILDLNVIYISPIERNTFYLEIFSRKDGEIASLSIDLISGPNPQQRATIDSLFSKSPIRTIVLYHDNYGLHDRWYSVTHEMIR